MTRRQFKQLMAKLDEIKQAIATCPYRYTCGGIQYHYDPNNETYDPSQDNHQTADWNWKQCCCDTMRQYLTTGWWCPVHGQK